jgi:type II secretory pathway component PulC
VKRRSVFYIVLFALLSCLPFPGNAEPAGVQPKRPSGSMAKKADSPPPAPSRSDSYYEAIPAGLPFAGAELGLKLTGTAVGNEPGRGVAIIENQSTRAQGAYRVGDNVRELLIKEIHSRFIIIGTGSGDVILAMGSVGRVGPLPSPRAAWLDRGEVQAAYPDYEHLMQEIRVRQRFEAGRPVGFVIYNIAPGSIFERMGLANGDVIAAVNDRPFESSQPVAEFYDAIHAGGSLSLDFSRADSNKSLHIEIQ